MSVQRPRSQVRRLWGMWLRMGGIWRMHYAKHIAARCYFAVATKEFAPDGRNTFKRVGEPVNYEDIEYIIYVNSCRQG